MEIDGVYATELEILLFQTPHEGGMLRVGVGLMKLSPIRLGMASTSTATRTSEKASAGGRRVEDRKNK
jgi:hypothetical protein